uniref:Uncharacterized protein n=1 Tax=Pelodiscus sinensis TaxID=13735 RepID=K7F0Z7_PELSI
MSEGLPSSPSYVPEYSSSSDLPKKALRNHPTSASRGSPLPPPSTAPAPKHKPHAPRIPHPSTSRSAQSTMPPTGAPTLTLGIANSRPIRTCRQQAPPISLRNDPFSTTSPSASESMSEGLSSSPPYIPEPSSTRAPSKNVPHNPPTSASQGRRTPPQPIIHSSHSPPTVTSHPEAPSERPLGTSYIDFPLRKGRLPCPYCPTFRGTLTLGALSKHMRNIHHKQIGFRCRKCKDRFHTQKACKLHQRSCMPPEPEVAGSSGPTPCAAEDATPAPPPPEKGLPDSRPPPAVQQNPPKDSTPPTEIHQHTPTPEATETAIHHNSHATTPHVSRPAGHPATAEPSLSQNVRAFINDIRQLTAPQHQPAHQPVRAHNRSPTLTQGQPPGRFAAPHGSMITTRAQTHAPNYSSPTRQTHHRPQVLTHHSADPGRTRDAHQPSGPSDQIYEDIPSPAPTSTAQEASNVQQSTVSGTAPLPPPTEPLNDPDLLNQSLQGRRQPRERTATAWQLLWQSTLAETASFPDLESAISKLTAELAEEARPTGTQRTIKR